ncbi:MAG: HD domain-containing phosphohydrolase [Gallionellaceae bacterium]
MVADSAFAALYKYTKALSVALGYRDQLTRLHSERVVALSEALGTRFGLSGSEMEILKIGASFHDIGKIGIEDRILMKTSELGPDEWIKMREHAVIGESILLATGLEGSQQAAQIIRHHHEHYDGLGYPDRLAGEDIPIYSRIISITDSYDAMAVTRSYHRPRKHSEIMEALHRETGVKHDPQLMHLFVELIEDSELRAADG